MHDIHHADSARSPHPGHWLGAWSWNEVVEHLDEGSLAPVAMTLPGLDPSDPQRTTGTLEDQVSAIPSLLGQLGVSATRPAAFVAHSGANAPVTMVLDRHHELVSRVVWVDSGPTSSGGSFAPDLPAEVRELPLPPFEALGGQASLDGLDAESLERFRTRAVPEPAAVLRDAVALSDDARTGAPTTLVCCSMPSGQVMELAAAGHPMFAEVAKLREGETVDLPTGHRPMWSRPADLAVAIRAAVLRAG